MQQWLGCVTGHATWVFKSSECCLCFGADVSVVAARGAVTNGFRVRVLVSTIAVIGGVVGFCVATYSWSTQVIAFLADVIAVLFLCVIRFYVVVRWVGSMHPLVPNFPEWVDGLCRRY